MTTDIIYYDFPQADETAVQPETTAVLTQRVLTRGRRWHKFWNNTGKAIDTACFVLCGACITVSLAVLCHILLF